MEDPSSTFLFDSLRWAPFAWVFDLFLAKLLQIGAKLQEKLTTSFKNHTRNLSNLKQAVQSPKSSKSMSYFVQKLPSFH